MGPPLVLLVAGIIGADMAPNPELATLPISAVIVGTAVFTVPAALLMQKVGRRSGFIAAALVAALAALVAAYAIAVESFPLFCIMLALIGANAAFVQQYRFAATESSTADQAARAVSYLLIGGIAAGFLGPELGRVAKDWLPYGAYTGSFVILGLVYLAAVVVLTFLQDVTVQSQADGKTARPLRALAAQPTFQVAILLSLVAYAVMSFVMTATPISMHRMDGFSIDQTTRVIQSHIMAMYLPSLFSGFLYTRFGTLRMSAVGVACMLASVLISLSSQQLPAYWVALVLLGAGWNFLFIGGTVLLTESYQPDERFKAQAANDFLVFTAQAMASLSAGAIIFRAGWKTVNLLTVPVLLLAAAALFALSRRARPTRQRSLST